MSNLANNTVTMEEILALVQSLPEGGGGEGLLKSLVYRTITEYSDSEITTVAPYVFYGCQQLASLDIPNVTSIGIQAFANCAALTSLDFEHITKIPSGAFGGCGRVTSINFPKVNSIESQAFMTCMGLTHVDFPLVNSLGSGVFYYCMGLKIADFSQKLSIPSQTFFYCRNLNALILRSSTVCTLSATDAFKSSKIANGTGYVYVPAALVDSYKAATNWSTYANQFRALEDYTVDGTVTGELDETKI